MADTLMILAHGDSWERRFQISSLAASTAAEGHRVELALFFGALRAWVDGRWDEADPSAGLRLLPSELASLPPLSSLFTPGREAGRIRLYACSASTRLLGLSPELVAERVEAIAGWTTFSRMALRAASVVTL